MDEDFAILELSRTDITTLIILTETKFSEHINGALEVKLENILEKLYKAREEINNQN